MGLLRNPNALTAGVPGIRIKPGGYPHLVSGGGPRWPQRRSSPNGRVGHVWVPSFAVVTSSSLFAVIVTGDSPAHGIPQRLPARRRALAVDGEALGRSRGGLSTKFHLAVDRHSLPMRVALTPGPVRGATRSCCRCWTESAWRAWARAGRGGAVITDKACSRPYTRQAMRRRRIRFVCPERDDQTAHRPVKGSRGGRPPGSIRIAKSTAMSWSAASTRSSSSATWPPAAPNCAACYHAELTIAAIIFWLRRIAGHPRPPGVPFGG